MDNCPRDPPGTLDRVVKKETRRNLVSDPGSRTTSRHLVSLKGLDFYTRRATSDLTLGPLRPRDPPLPESILLGCPE